MSRFLTAMIAVAITLGLSFIAFGQSHTAKSSDTKAFGHLHYELGEKVVTRDIVMKMKKGPEGEAIFVLNFGKKKLKSTSAFMKSQRGGKIAYVAFKDAWTMNGKTSHLLFKGLKLQGKNKMVYQGSLYKTTDAALAEDGETFSECVEKIKSSGKLDAKWKISGAFKLKKHLTQR